MRAIIVLGLSGLLLGAALSPASAQEPGGGSQPAPPLAAQPEPPPPAPEVAGSIVIPRMVLLEPVARDPRVVASRPAKAAPQEPWCPQDRRIGSGSGFCRIN